MEKMKQRKSLWKRLRNKFNKKGGGGFSAPSKPSASSKASPSKYPSSTDNKTSPTSVIGIDTNEPIFEASLQQAPPDLPFSSINIKKSTSASDMAMIRSNKDGGSKRRVSIRIPKDRKTFKAKGPINISAKAALDEGTILMAVARFPLLFFQWPYLGGILFFASIFLANIVLGDRCDADGSEFALSVAYSGTLLSSIQESLICGTSTQGFSLGKTERIIMWLLSLCGILENVLPKYIQKKVAQRHMGQRTANRALLFHIAAGIITVLGNGLVGILHGGFSGHQHSGFIFWFLAGTDLFHQLSILLLTKNHDGVYALRPGNLAFGVLKFTRLINHSRHTRGADLSDVWFTASFGFLGTRIAAAGAAAAMYFADKDGKGLQNEDWYSLGVTFAHLLLAMRITGAEKVFFYVTPVSACLFYHELWDKSKKPQFIAWNMIYSVVCLTCLDTPGEFYAAMIVYYYLAGFGFHKKRFYRWPKNAFKGTNKEEENKIDKKRAMMRMNSTWKHSFKS